jgi:eukaryotic-like serine/threonine-protein kinase
MDPPANSLIAPGSTITLFVSKGPREAAVPDVTSFSRPDAIATIRNSDFKVVVDVQDTDDPSLDGVVLTQTPGPGDSAKPGSTVTITVGHYVAPPPTATQPAATQPTTTQATTTTTEAPTPVAPTVTSSTDTPQQTP